jgi:hypothetical protein
MFYLWAIPITRGTIFQGWLTFRLGPWHVIEDPANFYLLVILIIVCATFWQARPRKPAKPIRLDLK